MHSEVIAWLESVRARRPELFDGQRVLECGSYDINGSARPLFQSCDYVGLDWRPGPGVDVVALVHAYAPADLFDVAISTEMLEHDPYWDASVERMCELLRPGGVLLLTWATPARPVHEVATAPIGGYYRGLTPVAVADVCRPFFERVEAGTARGGLDGWLVGEGRGHPRMLAHTNARMTGEMTGDRTRLSVVIGAVGNVELTRRCVESVRRFARLQPEIVLVDNGSTEEESLALAGLGADVFLSHREMLGYPAAVNVGVRASSGELVCLLNNDAEATQVGWDERLAAVLEAVPEAAMVAPVTDFAFNPGQQAAGPAAAQDDLMEADRLVFVCVMMRRALFDQLGGLDEGYGLGNWEDTDFSWAVRERGGRLLIDPAVFVRHVGHQTMYKLPEFGELLETNRRRFMQKWGVE